MDELIGRLVSNAGIDAATAKTAIGIILDFLQKEGPAATVEKLVSKLPGADALIAETQAQSSGFDMGGVMGVGSKLMAAGLDMGQIQSVTKEMMANAREQLGSDEFGELVSSIPGLSQFV